MEFRLGFCLKLWHAVLRLMVAAALLSCTTAPRHAFAATLPDTGDSLSSSTGGATATHTIALTTASAVPLQEIDFHFNTSSNSGIKPAGLDVSTATLGSVTGDSATWTLDTSRASTGILAVVADSPTNPPAGTHITVQLQHIVNPDVGNCQTGTYSLQDTCWINIYTYSDQGLTNYDEGDTSYTVNEDPQFSLQVSAVASGTTSNGIVSTAASAPTAMSFLHLQSGGVEYITQKLSITSNAPGGYTVYAQLANPLSGSSGNDQLSPFGATDATWTTPKAWMSPTGLLANSNSGWIGANTSDTRVNGWSSASAEFGPVSTSRKPVAYSGGPDTGGSTIYVTYAVGTNSLQASDTYTGNIIYSVQAIY